MKRLVLPLGLLLLALVLPRFRREKALAVPFKDDTDGVTEQHAHSFLEVVPLMAAAFAIVLHWKQFRALVGAGPERADFALRPKQHPLPRSYLAGIFTIVALLGVLPFLEEFWRCYRTD